MNIAIASDHGGYALKQALIPCIERLGHTVCDLGCDSTDRCDYPRFGAVAARAVASGECERGIVICTTGIGISIAANKVPGVRCALCAEPYSAEMTRRHNDANLLALGAGLVGPGLAERIVRVFLETGFEAGRHALRVNQITELEG